MRINIPRFCNVILLGAALVIPVGSGTERPASRENNKNHTYHDKDHNDEHKW